MQEGNGTLRKRRLLPALRSTTVPWGHHLGSHHRAWRLQINSTGVSLANPEATEQVMLTTPDSYLSGVTVFSHGSPRPDQYSPPPHDTKKLSFQSYGHYTSIPSGPDHYSSHPAHAAVPVELPLSYPAVQELPADFHTINYNAQRDSGTLGLSPEPPSSRHSNSPTVTPMSSPRLAEESTFRQAQSPEHLRTMSAGGGRSTGGYYYTPTRAGQTYQGG